MARSSKKETGFVFTFTGDFRLDTDSVFSCLEDAVSDMLSRDAVYNKLRKLYPELMKLFKEVKATKPLNHLEQLLTYSYMSEDRAVELFGPLLFPTRHFSVSESLDAINIVNGDIAWRWYILNDEEASRLLQAFEDHFAPSLRVLLSDWKEEKAALKRKEQEEARLRKANAAQQEIIQKRDLIENATRLLMNNGFAVNCDLAHDDDLVHTVEKVQGEFVKNTKPKAVKRSRKTAERQQAAS